MQVTRWLPGAASAPRGGDGKKGVVRTLGKSMISVGVGVLLFVAWVFWGTGLHTAREQRRLSESFESAIRETPDRHSRRGPPASFAPAPGDPVFRIRIPAIDLNDGKGYIVVEGVGDHELERGPGHYPECGAHFDRPLCTPFDAVWPGEEGRVVVSGHRTTHLAPFLHTDELDPGDEIVLETTWGTFRYVVYAQRSVEPDDATIVVPIHDDRQLVLTTCDPPLSAARRLVTFARLVTPDR